jgi:hypothetical protein
MQTIQKRHDSPEILKLVSDISQLRNNGKLSHEQFTWLIKHAIAFYIRAELTNKLNSALKLPSA